MLLQVKFEYNLDFESLSFAEVPVVFQGGVESKDWGKDPPRALSLSKLESAPHQFWRQYLNSKIQGRVWLFLDWSIQYSIVWLTNKILFRKTSYCKGFADICNVWNKWNRTFSIHWIKYKAWSLWLTNNFVGEITPCLHAHWFFSITAVF